jgi:uncharacterized RDD family membrane protein YckC
MYSESTVEPRYCSQCGQSRPADELASFGGLLVCASCKETYAQKLREGIITTTALDYAGFWIRVAAVLIDAIILFVIQFVLQMAFAPVLLSGKPAGSLMAILVVNLIGVAMAATYESVLIARYAATPGKMAMGLAVVRADGSPVSLGRALGRYFSKILSSMTLLIGYIMVAFDSQKRGLHDIICDTRVIKNR